MEALYSIIGIFAGVGGIAIMGNSRFLAERLYMKGYFVVVFIAGLFVFVAGVIILSNNLEKIDELHEKELLEQIEKENPYGILTIYEFDSLEKTKQYRSKRLDDNIFELSDGRKIVVGREMKFLWVQEESKNNESFE